jgi:outer membrane protein OmpA-like peptidoglycan-associated protein
MMIAPFVHENILGNAEKLASVAQTFLSASLFRTVRVAQTRVSVLLWAIFIAILLIHNIPLFSQQPDTTKPSILRFGLGAQALFGVHAAQFRSLVLTDKSKESCCSKNYDVLPNIGFSVNALTELPLFERGGIAVRLGLSGLSTGFRSRDSLPVAAPNGVDLLNGTLTYSLQTSLLWLDVEPYFTIRPTDFLSLYAGVGGKVSILSSYSQREDFTVSDGANSSVMPMFPQRNVSEGAISGVTPFLPVASIGASYELPFGEQGNVLLAPEFFATLPLGSLISPNSLKARKGANANAQGFWTMIALRGGVSVRFSPERTTQQMETEVVKIQREQNRTQDSTDAAGKRTRDSNEIAHNTLKEVNANKVGEYTKRNILLAITKVQGIFGVDSTLENPTLQVEEFAASRSRYILNNIFFDARSSAFATRYRRLRTGERDRFQLDSLADLSVLQIYYEVLNILGKRMNTHPKAILSLTGFADGLTEKNDKKLAEARANSVRTYLEEVWNIEPSRIKTKTGISRNPAGSDGDEVLEAEEQRRVEVQCDVAAVMEEMRFEYTLREISPPKIRIETEILSEMPLQYWHVEFLQKSTRANSNSIVLFSRQDTSHKETSSVWDIRGAQESQTLTPISSTEPVLVRLWAKKTNGDSTEAESRTIPVSLHSVEEKRQRNAPDERVDSYTLFSFAYGTNAPLSGNAEAQRIIGQIKRTLKAGAKVKITGYSDSRGNLLTNNLLSFQRAQSVATSIGFAKADVEGVGVTELNDNRLPEGRFYNRFVQVDVRTPLR